MSDPNFYSKVGTDVKRTRGLRDEAANPVSGGVPAAVQQNAPATLGLKRWSASHDMYWGATQTHDALPPGLYRGGEVPGIGVVLLKQNVETDGLLDLPDDASVSIVAEFEKFWTIGDEFRKRGFTHKRGFLLWGPPGSGKTSTIHLLVDRLIKKHSGVVLFLDHPRIAAECLRMVRQIEPSRPMIAILEDIDALVDRFGENEYLALLDGEAQVGNIVFVGTTNYPERLDRRFVDRPSRFDTIRYIGMPSAAARRAYLQAKEPSLTSEELSEWVRMSEGFSVAHLKEMIVAVRCLGQPLDAAVERLEQMRESRPSSFKDPQAHGGFFKPNGGWAEPAEVQL